MAYLEVWVDPESWETRNVVRAKPPRNVADDDPRIAPKKLWRIVLTGDNVRVIRGGAMEDDLGVATWDEKKAALTDRSAVDSAVVTRAAWKHLEAALAQAIATPASAPSAAPAMVAPPVALAPATPRSGWAPLLATLASGGAAAATWQLIPGDVGLGVVGTLGALTLGLAIYTLYGATTYCPSCRSWYRRTLASRDLMSASTENRQESVAVYDASGNRSGSTTRSVSYEVRRYNYHYRCAVCGHTWSRQGMSTRRLM